MLDTSSTEEIKTTTKYCVDCVHHRHTTYGRGRSYDVCTRSQTSYVRPGSHRECDGERSHGVVADDNCKPEGRFFEQKPAPGANLREVFGLDNGNSI